MRYRDLARMAATPFPPFHYTWTRVRKVMTPEEIARPKEQLRMNNWPVAIPQADGAP
jgi:hypothetical protein